MTSSGVGVGQRKMAGSGSVADYQCNYCQEEITEIRVKCSQCQDFDLCLQCFSCGVEIGQHKNKHGYELIDCGTFLIFPTAGAWKAVDELLLLEAVEHYGFGNWEGIAQHFKDRSLEDVRDHYIDMYIYGNIGEASWPLQTLHTVTDQTFSSNDEILLPPEELTPQEQKELGYLPKRDDFEWDYDNNAESVACNLCIRKDDDEVEVALTLAILDGYNQRLRERLRRKRIAREHKIFQEFFSSNNSKPNNPKKRSSYKDEKLQEKLKVFCQFQTGAERDQFFKNMLREKDLKRRIDQLMKYRKCGLTKLDECTEFDTIKYMKNKKKGNNKLGNSKTMTLGKFTMVYGRGGERDDIHGQERKKRNEEIVRVSILAQHICGIFLRQKCSASLTRNRVIFPAAPNPNLIPSRNNCHTMRVNLSILRNKVFSYNNIFIFIIRLS
ncbi:transcriptional adapter 2-beta-like isoform X1 [Tachypleus tridentatus]|uniref:transcriptional adapter 2-beta-like isoform X1 n=1 Tax=Tachypleus tridentatus TaxID=6853 RepID=UPI003FD5F4CF